MTADAGQMLRKCFGTFATGVALALAASEEGDGLIGVTVNSFSSVSLAPPLLQFNLKKGSRMLKSLQAPSLISAGSPFQIWMLSADQKEISDFYAWGDNQIRRHPSMVDDDSLFAGTAGPALAGGLARFLCRVHQLVEAGDHYIVLGLIEGHSLRDDSAAPLLYYRGKYRSVPAADWIDPPADVPQG